MMEMNGNKNSGSGVGEAVYVGDGKMVGEDLVVGVSRVGFGTWLTSGVVVHPETKIKRQTV